MRLSFKLAAFIFRAKIANAILFAPFSARNLNVSSDIRWIVDSDLIM